MTVALEKFEEPLRTTLLRNVVIAVVAGAAVAAWSGGGIRALPWTILLALWPTLGGHWVEIFFLNLLRPRLPAARGIRVAVRLVLWFFGGVALAAAMNATAAAVRHDARPPRWPAWWVGGVAFIAIELIVHLVLQLRGLGSFYNGRN